MKRIMMTVMILTAGSTLAASQAYAEGGKPSATPQAKWETECGSCHVAYPARFLNAETWRRLMGGLDKHFGDDAVLDAELNNEILEYLERNAGSGQRRGAATLRISDTTWFVHAHDEVPARAWASPAVKSRANCTACHINAVTRGDWSERGVRMPAGLGGRDGGEQEDDDEDDD